MKKLLLIASILLFQLTSFAQAPAIEWKKTYGGNFDEIPSKIRKTSDGGYIIAGTANGLDSGDVTGNHSILKDFWVVKVNNNGAIQWQKTYGGTSDETSYSIEQTADGGYIIAGETSSNNGDVLGNHNNSIDVWVIKINSTGTLQWQKTLGGTQTDRACSVQQTADGGYIVGGTTSSVDGDITSFHGNETADFWLIKLNSSGALQWQKTIGGSGNDSCVSMQITPDGGYIMVGDAGSTDGDVTDSSGWGTWVVKLSSTGAIQWNKSYSGPGNISAFTPKCIRNTTDGGYVLTGSSYLQNSAAYCVLKIDSIGTIQWIKSFGGILNDYAEDIQQTTDGGYIVAGTTRSTEGDVSGNHGIDDYWIIKLNSFGTLIWQKALGGSLIDHALSIVQTSDGGYIVAGDTVSNDGDVIGYHCCNPSDFWVVKLAGPGASCTVPTSLATSNISDVAATISWTQPANPDASTASSWEVIALPCSSAIPTASTVGTLVTNNPYTITGLTASTCYKFYVRAKCSSSDKSEWSLAVTGTTTVAVQPVCGSTFIDVCDISGDYLSNSDFTYYFCPDTFGQKITVTFTSFNVEAQFDALYVYNGFGDTSPQIMSSNAAGSLLNLPGGYWGTTIPGPFTSTSADGCLTFRFVSDNDTNFAGWTANVTCSNLATEDFKQQSIELYPNPTKTILNINIGNITNLDKITVTDLTGKIILQTQNTTKINVADLAVGIYIIEVNAGDKKFQSKFVKE